MDKIDREILKLLQQNADITNVALADKVNLSPSSCLRRVQRLKKSGAICKTVAVLDDRVLGRQLLAIVEIDLNLHGNAVQDQLKRKLRDEPCVDQAYGISGEADIILILKLVDMEEFQGICDRLFNNDPNILRFRTSFVLDTVKRS